MATPPPQSPRFSRAQIAGTQSMEADADEHSLRPLHLAHYIGQEELKQNLSVYLNAALRRKETLDHVLFSGPPGLGKTTLAQLLGRELAAPVHSTAGPILERQGDLAAVLTSLEPGSLLFIDEIHRIPRSVEEILYSAMEDKQLDILIGQGPMARTVKIDLAPFTLVGATTRTGLISAPLRDRFGILMHLRFYAPSELQQILLRSARILGLQLDAQAALEIGHRARGTPRIANRLLRRISDHAEHDGQPRILLSTVRNALERMGIDAAGLDQPLLELLRTLVDRFQGGPVGLSTLTAALTETRDTIEEIYEPYLIKEGFVQKTARGRLATPKAFQHLGHATPTGSQMHLWKAPSP